MTRSWRSDSSMAAKPSSRKGTRTPSSSGSRSGSKESRPSRSTSALDAMADAMISPCTLRLSYLAVINQACCWLSQSMPPTSTARPKRLASTIRRASVRVSAVISFRIGPWVSRYCQISTVRCHAAASHGARAVRLAIAPASFSDAGTCHMRSPSSAMPNSLALAAGSPAHRPGPFRQGFQRRAILLSGRRF